VAIDRGYPHRSGISLTTKDEESLGYTEDFDHIFEETTVWDIRNKKIYDAVEQLPERHKYVVEKTVFSNMKTVNAAKHLGVCKQRVSRIRQEAFKMLAEKLADLFVDIDKRN